MTELLPCPFCGSLQREYLLSSGESCFVICSECHAAGPRVFGNKNVLSKEARAVEKWNERKMSTGTVWHQHDDYPDDDRTILVTWKNGDGTYREPIRAYYEAAGNAYFGVGTFEIYRLNIEIWCEIPKLPY